MERTVGCPVRGDGTGGFKVLYVSKTFKKTYRALRMGTASGMLVQGLRVQLEVELLELCCQRLSSNI